MSAKKYVTVRGGPLQGKRILLTPFTGGSFVFTLHGQTGRIAENGEWIPI